MNMPLTFIPYVNVLIVIFIVLMMFSGYKKGFLYQVFSLIGLLAAILISWFFAPVFAQMWQVYPIEWCPFAYTDFAEIFYTKMNTLVWYVLLFIIVGVIFMLLKPFAKSVQKVPLLGHVNKLLGMLFGLIPAFVVIVFLTYFLSTPIIKNGKDVIDQTWLAPIRNVTLHVVTILEKPYELNEAIQKLISDPLSLTVEDTELLLDWLTSEQDSTEGISDFLNEHSVYQTENKK